MADDDALVEAGARAIARVGGCFGSDDRDYTCSDMVADDNCECGKVARAVIAAVRPLIAAEERERAERDANWATVCAATTVRTVNIGEGPQDEGEKR